MTSQPQLLCFKIKYMAIRHLPWCIKLKDFSRSVSHVLWMSWSPSGLAFQPHYCTAGYSYHMEIFCPLFNMDKQVKARTAMQSDLIPVLPISRYSHKRHHWVKCSELTKYKLNINLQFLSTFNDN